MADTETKVEGVLACIKELEDSLNEDEDVPRQMFRDLLAQYVVGRDVEKGGCAKCFGDEMQDQHEVLQVARVKWYADNGKTMPAPVTPPTHAPAKLTDKPN